jgi:hypothetical protein
MLEQKTVHSFMRIPITKGLYICERLHRGNIDEMIYVAGNLVLCRYISKGACTIHKRETPEKDYDSEIEIKAEQTPGERVCLVWIKARAIHLAQTSPKCTELEATRKIASGKDIYLDWIKESGFPLP